MAELTITNTFTSNTTALASEVNQNFSDIETWLNNRYNNSDTWLNVSSISIFCSSDLNISDSLLSSIYNPSFRFTNETGTGFSRSSTRWYFIKNSQPSIALNQPTSPATYGDLTVFGNIDFNSTRGTDLNDSMYINMVISSATATSDCYMQIGNQGSGNSYLRISTNLATQPFYIGCDNDDSDRAKISKSSNLETSYITFDSSLRSIAFFSGNAVSFQTGQETIYIGNSSNIPTGNPSLGGFLYVQSGALKYRGSSGTITTLGAA